MKMEPGTPTVDPPLVSANSELTAAPILSRSRRRSALRLLILQGIATLFAVVAALVEIETIVGTGPVLAIVGFALAGVTRPLHSFQALIVSLSAPLVSALCAALIVVFSWGPNEAVWPICSLLICYSIFAILALIFAYAQIAKSSESSNRAWQFSLKSLLILTTVICVLLALGPIVLRNIDDILPQDEDVGFGGFSVIVFGIAFGFLTDHIVRDSGKQR